MNVKLLRKIQKHILAEPRRLAMKEWLQRKGEEAEKVDDYSLKFKFPKCDTAACIAGWACLLSADEPSKVSRGEVASTAHGLLDVPEVEFDYLTPSHKLFYVKDWPRTFRVAYRKARTPYMLAKTASARIEHYIKTKGKE